MVTSEDSRRCAELASKVSRKRTLGASRISREYFRTVERRLGVVKQNTDYGIRTAAETDEDTRFVDDESL